MPWSVASVDPSLAPRLSALRELRYASEPAPGLDVPPHVRAASAVRRVGSLRYVVQDDVAAIAVVDAAGHVRPVVLPPGPHGARSFDDRAGNKHLKLDLEAGVVLPDGRFVAFGSGATMRRERLVAFDGDGAVRVLTAAPLYAALRETAASGVPGRLNVEGAVVVGDRLRLFQRAVGPEPANASVDVDLDEFLAWLDGEPTVPAPRDLRRFDLGAAGGCAFGFTDAAALDDGRVAFVACAEDSLDPVRDGPVLGCRFGVIDGGAVRCGDVVGEDGRPTRLKVEGLEPRPGEPGAFDVVVDFDDPARPSLLGRLDADPAALRR